MNKAVSSFLTSVVSKTFPLQKSRIFWSALHMLCFQFPGDLGGIINEFLDRFSVNVALVRPSHLLG